MIKKNACLCPCAEIPSIYRRNTFDLSEGNIFLPHLWLQTYFLVLTLHPGSDSKNSFSSQLKISHFGAASRRNNNCMQGRIQGEGVTGHAPQRSWNYDMPSPNGRTNGRPLQIYRNNSLWSSQNPANLSQKRTNSRRFAAHTYMTQILQSNKFWKWKWVAWSVWHSGICWHQRPILLHHTAQCN